MIAKEEYSLIEHCDARTNSTDAMTMTRGFAGATTMTRGFYWRDDDDAMATDAMTKAGDVTSRATVHF